jgi:hypothetical protein
VAVLPTGTAAATTLVVLSGDGSVVAWEEVRPAVATWTNGTDDGVRRAFARPVVRLRQRADLGVRVRDASSPLAARLLTLPTLLSAAVVPHPRGAEAVLLPAPATDDDDLAGPDQPRQADVHVATLIDVLTGAPGATAYVGTRAQWHGRARGSV